MKQAIKNRLIQALRNKFENYKPESSYMPFHTRLLGKDRMALYSFIQNLNTNFGTSIFEPVAEELGFNKFDSIKRQVSAGDTVTKNAQKVIQEIMDNLESASAKPNKQSEIARILEVAQSGETSRVKPTKIDLFLQKDFTCILLILKPLNLTREALRNLNAHF